MFAQAKDKLSETTKAVSKEPSQSSKPSMIEQFMPFVFVLAIIYFLFIRPQQKRMKKQAEFTKNLKKGDEILTSGGLLGKIEGLTDQYIILEIAEKVRVRVLRQHISSFPHEKQSQPTQQNAYRKQ